MYTIITDEFGFRPNLALWSGPIWRGCVAFAKGATTDFIRGSTHTNLVEQVWNAKVWKFAHKNSYFGKYVGAEGSGSMVEKKTDLLKNSGDRMTFAIDTPITDTGVVDDGTLTLLQS